ncbi:MAG: hypothetical protein LBS90_00985 [Oscillospiraceae bacterium]|nr:hypothetical protein [Oscillospiraceae bacterium]
MSVLSDGVFRIKDWRGLNENAGGGAELPPGEAAEMRNFRVASDGSLKLRPGYRVISGGAGFPDVRGVWTGTAAGRETVLAVSGGAVWELDTESGGSTRIPGTLTDAETHIFGFGGRVYFLNGYEYLVWDGEGAVAPVEGYRPLTYVSCSPAGGGVPLEAANLLTGAVRVRFSPSAGTTTLKLGAGVASVDYIKPLSTGVDLAPGAYSFSDASGVVTLSSALSEGTDSVEVGYTFALSQRGEIEAMRYSEVYSGYTDNRVFLYGDGTNRTVYSGLDSAGNIRADYFPALGEMRLGVTNTAITGMLRFGSKLYAFKRDGAFSVSASTTALEDGRVIPALYAAPVSRTVGNDVPGFAETVVTRPRTLHGGGVYEWSSGTSGAAAHISRRVAETLSGMDLPAARTFVDPYRHEYYIYDGEAAVVNNYLNDTWYAYSPFPAARLFLRGEKLYGVLTSGEAVGFSEQYRSDAGAAIPAVWRSGAFSFGRIGRAKYASRVFVAMKPEPRSFLRVTVLTDRAADGCVSEIASGLADFGAAHFAHWSFGTNREPRTKRVRLPVRRMTYLRLVLSSDDEWSGATVREAAIRLRTAGETR